MKKWNKWRFSLLVIGSLLVMTLGAYFWGFQTATALEYRWLGRETPVLWTTPLPLVNGQASQTEGAKLSHLGFEFEVPWSDLEKSRHEQNIGIFVFRSGIGISLFTPSAILPGISSNPHVQDAMRQMFGEEVTASEYALLKAKLEANPGQMKPWMPRGKAIRLATLLNMKAATLPGGDTGIFRVGHGNWRGFSLMILPKSQRKLCWTCLTITTSTPRLLSACNTSRAASLSPM